MYTFPNTSLHLPTRHDTTRHDTTRHDTTRHDTTRHDTTRHDTTRQTHLKVFQCSCSFAPWATPSASTPSSTPPAPSWTWSAFLDTTCDRRHSASPPSPSPAPPPSPAANNRGSCGERWRDEHSGDTVKHRHHGRPAEPKRHVTERRCLELRGEEQHHLRGRGCQRASEGRRSRWLWCRRRRRRCRWLLHRQIHYFFLWPEGVATHCGLGAQVFGVVAAFRGPRLRFVLSLWKMRTAGKWQWSDDWCMRISHGNDLWILHRFVWPLVYFNSGHKHYL